MAASPEKNVVTLHTVVVPADDEEEELLVSSSHATHSGISTHANKNHHRTLDGDGNDGDEDDDDYGLDIAYVPRAARSKAAAMNVGHAVSSSVSSGAGSVRKSFASALEPTVGISMDEYSSGLPDDTDKMQDAAEYEAWNARQELRKKCMPRGM